MVPGIHLERRESGETIGDPYGRQTNPDPFLTPHANIKTKWILDLNAKTRAIKLVRKEIVTWGKDFLDMTPKAQSIREKTEIGLHLN